jgi:hypothetical protein
MTVWCSCALSLDLLPWRSLVCIDALFACCKAWRLPFREASFYVYT